MRTRVIRNHNGQGAIGSPYDEGRIVQQALQSHGHSVQLMNPVPGFNGVPLQTSEHVVICTQPAKYNSAIVDFIIRNRTTPMAWRPGHAQLGFVEDLLESANVTVVHVCIEKAHTLTGLMSLSDAALGINAFNPETLVVVSDPSGAAACRFGRVTKVYSIRIAKTSVQDGKGPAFFGSFLGEWLNSGNVPLSLSVGHRYGAAMAADNWNTRDTFARSLPEPANAVLA